MSVSREELRQQIATAVHICWSECARLGCLGPDEDDEATADLVLAVPGVAAALRLADVTDVEFHPRNHEWREHGAGYWSNAVAFMGRVRSVLSEPT